MIFYITGNKVNQYGASDPLLSLPTSQVLVQTGHPQLTHLQNHQITVDGRILEDVVDRHQATRINGEIIDYFPAGPAIITLPLTWVLTEAGYDLVDPNINMAVQNRLAFITAATAFLLIFMLARFWFKPWSALGLAVVFFFGSVIFSTLGSAFWSLNYTTIFNLAVVVILVYKSHFIKDDSHQVSIGVLLGLLLFLSFFCRVSSVAIIVTTLAFLALTDFKQAVITGLTALFCLGLFVWWSLVEYGLILPPYYGLSRLDDAPVAMWVGILGNLFSPSRGIYVFMPWLILPTVLALTRPQLWKNKLFLYGFAWFVIQLIIVGRAVIWWGGGSYGPRLLVEAMPAILLIVLITLDESRDITPQQSKLVFLFFIAAGTISIWSHSWQAFFNPYTAGYWHDAAPAVVGEPTQDLGPYFEWSAAQWRADEHMVCNLDQVNYQQRILPFENSLEPIQANEVVHFRADKYQLFRERALYEVVQGERLSPFEPDTGNLALFEGMYVFKGGGRWTSCPTSSIYFMVDDDSLNDQLMLNIDLAALDEQQVELRLNDQPIASLLVTESQQIHSVQLNKSDFQIEGINRLELIPSVRRQPQVEQDGIIFAGPLGVKFSQLQLTN